MGNPTTCNGCGGSLETRYPAVLDPQTRETFAIDACQQCGLGHTSPQPEDLSGYYGAAYHGGRHGFTTKYCAWRRVRFVDGLTGAPGGRKLLDVGCGDGTFMLQARRRGWAVHGTEMNPTLAREAGLEVDETIEEAAGKGPFACVTLWHSLEHMRDPKGILRAAASVLEPGGTMMIAVPDAQGLQARFFGAKWFHLDVPRHLFHFSDKALTLLLEGLGLSVVRRWHQELELDLFGWTQSALNSVMPDPNVFFYRLTGRQVTASAGEVAANFVLGTALTAAAVPAVPAGTLAGKGGTLVFAAQKRG